MIYESIYSGFNSNDEVKQNIESYIRRENLLGSNKYTINDDLTIDVQGNLYLMNLNWTGRIPIRFGKINGSIHIEGCNNLTNLQGFPTYVNGDIIIKKNKKLESLKGCLVETIDDFICSDNALTSLEFSPKKVKGRFDCSNNKLTSLVGGPEQTNGFFCRKNELTNLIGAPKQCSMLAGSGNKLTSFEGIPEKVNSILIDSPYLYSIDYFPEDYRDSGRFVVHNGPLSLIYNESDGVFGNATMGEYRMETARLMYSCRMFVKGTNKIKLKNLKYFYHYLNEELTESDLNRIKISYEII